MIVLFPKNSSRANAARASATAGATTTSAPNSRGGSDLTHELSGSCSLLCMIWWLRSRRSTRTRVLLDDERIQNRSSKDQAMRYQPRDQEPIGATLLRLLDDGRIQNRRQYDDQQEEAVDVDLEKHELHEDHARAAEVGSGGRTCMIRTKSSGPLPHDPLLDPGSTSD